MKSKSILTDSLIRIKARIRDIDGDLIDPSAVEFELKKPGDTDYTVYTSLTTPTVVNQSVGIYYIDLEIDEPGRWKYSWFSYGNPSASWKSFFEVEDSRYQ